ncbi:MAG: hypothetical protein LBL62_03725 [Planctomycetaceae bacterium]|nr:hypothetical protein [Planctomycetaceae bacterium]
MQKEFNEIETRHAKKMLESSFGKPIQNTTFTLTYKENHYLGDDRPSKNDKATVKKVVEEAIPYIQGILNDIGISYQSKMDVYTSDYGNNYQNGSIHIDLHAEGGIIGMPLTSNPFIGVIHEIVHQIVDENDLLKNKLKQFTVDHTVGVEEWGQKWYLKLDIPMPSDYCTKIENKNDTYSEELLTMFFTCLCSDTSIRYDMNDVIRTGTDFAQKYPDYFNGIMTILRSLR